MVVYTDRSRIETDQQCHRLRAYAYEWEGRGLNLDGIGDTMGRDIGSCVHAGIASLLTAMQRGQPLTSDDLSEAEFCAMNTPEWSRFPDDQLDDACDMIRALLYTWWAVVRPQLASGWVVEDCEREEVVDFAVSTGACKHGQIPEGWACGPCAIDPTGLRPATVRFMSRLDLLASANGGLVLNGKPVPPGRWIWDWKCIKSGGDRWRIQQDYEMQWVSSLLGPEARLGQQLTGVIVCALLKENHPLVTCWRNRETGETTNRFRYTCADPHPFRYAKGGMCMGGVSHTLSKKEWEPIAVRDLPGGQAAYFEHLMATEPGLLAEWVDFAGPMRRTSTEVLERWKRQSWHREIQIARATAAANGAPFTEDVLDTVFPMRTANGNCTQFSRINADGQMSNGCPAIKFCWGGAVPEQFEFRTPNHPLEEESFPATAASDTLNPTAGDFDVEKN